MATIKGIYLWREAEIASFVVQAEHRGIGRPGHRPSKAPYDPMPWLARRLAIGEVREIIKT